MKRSIFAGCLAVLFLALAPALLLRPAADASPAPAEAAAVQETAPAAAETTAAPSVDESRSVTVLVGGTPRKMSLSDYLTGVVAAEMPVTFADAALEAQAVASRTFTLRRQEKPKHPNADVCDDSGCCQAFLGADELADKFGGGADAALKKVRAAVSATDGEVLAYRGALAETSYFSCSGGRTESAAAVWGSDVPYLRSVDSPGEENCARYSDSVVVPLDAFRSAILKAAPSADLSGEPAGWFGGETETDGGGVASLEIGGAALTGTKLRSLFSLRSTLFTVSVVPEGVRFDTKGYGHRVGMSQYGAEAMAENGADAAAILSHYYPGTELTRAAA